jgi:hypothetical protein
MVPSTRHSSSKTTHLNLNVLPAPLLGDLLSDTLLVHPIDSNRVRRVRVRVDKSKEIDVDIDIERKGISQL